MRASSGVRLGGDKLDVSGAFAGEEYVLSLCLPRSSATAIAGDSTISLRSWPMT
jgi:hypothetical protein